MIMLQQHLINPQNYQLIRYQIFYIEYNLKSFFGEGIVDSVVYNYNNSKGRFVSGTAESLKILYEKIKSGDYEFDNNVSYFSIYPSVYSIKRSFKLEAIRVIKDIKKSDKKIPSFPSVDNSWQVENFGSSQALGPSSPQVAATSSRALFLDFARTTNPWKQS